MMSITVDAPLSPPRAAGWGLVLLAPAALFLLAVMLKEGFGIGFLFAPVEALISQPDRLRVFNLVSPVVLLGGIAGALLLNSVAIGTLGVRWEENRLVGTVTIAPRTPNMALILAGCLMMAILLGYAFVENYSIVRTHP